MRVFYYSVFNNYGGLENFAFNLVSEVRKSNPEIEFTIISNKENFPFENDFVQLGCVIEILPSLKNPYAYYKKIKRILSSANLKEDVLQINICTYRNPFIHKAAKSIGIKTITVAHYTRVRGVLKLLHFINRRIYSKLGIKVSVSKDASNFAFGDNKNVIHIDNGINTNLIHYSDFSRRELRSELNLSNDSFLIGQVGRFAPEKNQLFTVRVFNEIIKKSPNVKLCFIGNGKHSKIDEYIKKHNLSCNVIFAQARGDEMAKWYSAMDLFLMPSVHEAASLTVLEALATGLNVVASPSVSQLDNNILIEQIQLDESKWVNYIIDFINSYKTRTRTNYLANSKYTISYCSNRYVDLYLNYDKYFK